MRRIFNTNHHKKKSFGLFAFVVALIGLAGTGLLVTNQASAAVTRPAQLVGGGAQWKLTVPKGHSTGAGIKEYKAGAFDSYVSSQYALLNSSKTGLVMRVWHGDGTTSGSGNPRTELRERYPLGGDTEGYWSTKGTHIMEVVTQVNRLTKKKPHVVIAQVHGGDDDVSVWRVEGNKLWITSGDNTHGKLVDGNFQLGKQVKLKYVITNGTFNYYYNDKKVNYALRYSGTGYFKAGNYLQSNPKTAGGESKSQYSEVVLYCAKIAHNKALAGGGCAETAPAPSPTPTGDLIPNVISEAACRSLDRDVQTVSGKKYCAKRKDGKTVAGAGECIDPKPGYAKFTYISSSTPHYCGYW
jgi:hypothetical protein